MSKKRNYASVKKETPAKRAARQNEKKLAMEAQRKKQIKQIIIGGAIALAAIVGITFALLTYYGDNVVARFKGNTIRASDIVPHVGTADSQLRARQADIWTQDWERDLREEAVRVVAMPYLYEYFGRGIGLTFGDDYSSFAITNAVTEAIINDPALFADFQQYMEAGPTLAEVEAQHAEAMIEMDAAEALANEILERIQAGEDFSELMHTYTADVFGLADHPYGYTFAEWQMVPEFSQGTLDLEIGEVGGPVLSTHGFHIIKRIEPDPDNVMQDVDVPEDELLAAMHILISTPNVGTLEETIAAHEMAEIGRMREAVSTGFHVMLHESDLTFRPALNRVEI